MIRGVGRHRLRQPSWEARVLDMRGRPSTGSGSWVSIVVPTRNGANHLRQLLTALARAEYRRFDVVVVDNGSTDGTGSVLSEKWPFELTVIRNDENRSFSDANNQAAGSCRGDLLLFMNNDVVPVGGDWLGWLVATQEARPDVSAIGALLMHPPSGETPSVQHEAIRFRFRDGFPHPFNVGGGPGDDRRLARPYEVPAATAAVLMVPRVKFERVGGFSSGYWYGAEDVDLCLKLRPLGPILIEGRAVFVHEESATQKRSPRQEVIAYRAANWRLFRTRWAARLMRSILADHLAGGGFWCGEPWPVSARLAEPPSADVEGWLASAGINGIRGSGGDVPLLLGLVEDPGQDPGELGVPLALGWAVGREDEWGASRWIDRYRVVIVSAGHVGQMPVPKLSLRSGLDTSEWVSAITRTLYVPRVLVRDEPTAAPDLRWHLADSGLSVTLDDGRDDVEGALFDVELDSGDSGAEISAAGSWAPDSIVERVWRRLSAEPADCEGRAFAGRRLGL